MRRKKQNDDPVLPAGGEKKGHWKKYKRVFECGRVSKWKKYQKGIGNKKEAEEGCCGMKKNAFGEGHVKNGRRISQEPLLSILKWVQVSIHRVYLKDSLNNKISIS